MSGGATKAYIVHATGRYRKEFLVWADSAAEAREKVLDVADDPDVKYLDTAHAANPLGRAERYPREDRPATPPTGADEQ